MSALAATVWLVDDDPSIRFVLEKALSRDGHSLRSFDAAAALLAALKTSADEDLPAVLVSDIRMPGMTGLALLAEVKARCPNVAVVIMTAYSDLDSAVAAFAGGAFEYLPKPFDIARASDVVRRAAAHHQSLLAPHIATAAAPALPTQLPSSSELLGNAPAMQELFRGIGRLSQSLVTVLITGETGSGKELVAQALHKHSSRAKGPFVAINTAAIPRDLLESELFGHERGSFTGAAAQRKGRFEQAEGGTLFLDEIGDMPFELQTRLLRVLSDGQFYRVGGHNPVQANVRVVAATHQNLEQRVAQGQFREDLLHRLNVIRLRLPPLRERRADIALLAAHFLHSSAQELRTTAKTLASDARAVLERFDYPGNVRQLQNICHWLSVMVVSDQVTKADLPPELLAAQTAVAVAVESATAEALAHPVAGRDSDQAPTVVDGVSGTDALGTSDWQQGLTHQAALLFDAQASAVWDTLSAAFERTLIQAALRATQGKKAEAAERLGIGRNTLTRKLAELSIE